MRSASKSGPKAVPKFWREWLLDVTSWDADRPHCFVPYERETDSIVFGMNVLSDVPPGELVGVCHEDGQAAVEAWCDAHPDWHKAFSAAIKERT